MRQRDVLEEDAVFLQDEALLAGDFVVFPAERIGEKTGRPPAGLWIPDTGVAPYRGRG